MLEIVICGRESELGVRKTKTKEPTTDDPWVFSDSLLALDTLVKVYYYRLLI